MNAMVINYTKIALFLGLLVIASSNSVVLAKCNACQQAAAIKQSIKDAAIAAAALAASKPSTANKPSSREMELDSLDLMSSSVCVCCAEKGERRVDESGLRCAVCQEELIKNSIAEAAAAALAAATVVSEKIQLDSIPVATNRAAREGLNDMCGVCETCADDEISACQLENQLRAIMNCCVCTNQEVHEQGNRSKRYSKQLRHEINNIEELVESHIDQSAECCSIIETRIGDLDGLAIGIPTCEQQFNVVDVINNTNADVITWLKSLYILLYQVYQCSCAPCGEN